MTWLQSILCALESIFDGVLASFDRAFNTLVSDLFPEKNIQIDYESPNWSKEEILTPEEMSKIWSVIRSTPNFWSSLPAYSDNVNAMYRFLIRRRDAVVYYITSRIETNIGAPVITQTRNWLEGQGINKPNTSIVVVRPAITPDEVPPKLQVVDALGVQLHIDDYGPTVIQLGKRGVLLDRPWNREYAGVRLHSLEDFLNAAEENAER